MAICKHPYTRNVPSGNDTHYAKAICVDCHKFVKWIPRGSSMSKTLLVPYDDKDEAKKRGARWDPFEKMWYAPNERYLQLLEQWDVFED